MPRPTGRPFDRPSARPSLPSIDLKDGQKRFLGDLDGADLLHALLPLFLFLEKLALARDVPAVALGEDVLPERRDRLAGDDLVPDGGLDAPLVELPGDELLQLLGDLLAPLLRLVAVDDHAEGVDRVAVDEH